MTDIPLETKNSVIGSIALDHGASEAALAGHWDQWLEDTPVPVDVGLSSSHVKQWFTKYLASLGVISSTSTAPLRGEDVGDSFDEEDNDPHDAYLNSGAGAESSPLEPFDDYNYDDCMDAGSAAVNEEARGAIVRANVRPSRAGNRVRWKSKPYRIIADPHLDDDQFVDKILRRQGVRRSGERVAAAAAATVTGSSQQHARIPDETFEAAERKLMDSLLEEAKLSQQRVNEDDDTIDNGSIATETPAVSVGSKLMPAGVRIPRKELGSRRMRSAVSKFVLGKAVGDWAVRHRSSEPEAAFFTGQQIGNALALRIAAEDNKFGRTRKHPISTRDIEARHSAIIQTLIEGIAAAGRTSEAAQEYATATMAVIHDQIHAYARIVGTISSSFSGSQADSLPAGSLVDRIRSMAKGTRRKGRALLNEAEKRIMISRIIELANWALTMPGEPPAARGFGRDRFVTSLIDRFGRDLTRTLTSATKGTRAARSDGASYAVISLMQGAITAFIEHPRMKPYLPTLFAAADRRLDQLNPQGYENVGGDDNGDEPGERPLPAVPAQSQALASVLVDKARAYLQRNESLAKRAGSRYVLMVPGDAKCVDKVRGTVMAADDGADKYVKNGLLTHHPNAELDKSGHLISMAGSVLHLAAAGDKTREDDGLAKPLRLTQMQRSGLEAANLHDEPWDRESRNVGGPIEPKPNRVPMRCVVSEAPSTAGDDERRIRVLYYWPQDE